jgi:hypothetical protein
MAPNPYRSGVRDAPARHKHQGAVVAACGVLVQDGRIDQPLTALLTAKGCVRTHNRFNRDYPWEQYWLHESIAQGSWSE